MSLIAMIAVAVICLAGGELVATPFIAGALVGILVEIRGIKEKLETK